MFGGRVDGTTSLLIADLTRYRRMAQLLERSTCTLEDVGSNPAWSRNSYICKKVHGRLFA